MGTKFTVEVTETITYRYEVEAGDEAEAEEKAIELCMEDENRNAHLHAVVDRFASAVPK